MSLPFWMFGLGLASCILLFLWLDRKNKRSESNELTEDGLSKTDAEKQINWKRVAVTVGVVLVALWKVTVWLLKTSSKLAGNYSGDDVLTRNLQE